MKKLFIYSTLACLALASCKPNLEPNAPQTGDADFSYYLAVGNSLTAGFSNGSLYRSGQMNSFPAMLATQFKQVSNGKFEQPLLPGEHGYPNGKIILAMKQGLCDTVPSLAPIPFPGALDSAGSSVNLAFKGPFNNMGIPGIRTIDFLFPGYGAVNPYAARIFVSPLTNRPLDELKLQKHTFFSLWLGGNDVLGYAVAGGEQGSGPTSSISDLAVFTAAYDSVMQVLTANGAKGIVINIPDVTSLPYFNTIPANSAEVTKAQANLLNNAYNGTQVHFNPGKNYLVIQDANSPTGFRQMKKGELVRLETPLDSIKCAGWGTQKPIPAQFVLTEDEIAKVNTALLQFNSVISTMAAKYSVPMVDMNSYLKSLSTGISYNGITYTPEFVSGGAFSLDGIHLTGKGYALAANHMIMTINSYYKSSIASVDPNEYDGIQFP